MGKRRGQEMKKRPEVVTVECSCGTTVHAVRRKDMPGCYEWLGEDGPQVWWLGRPGASGEWPAPVPVNMAQRAAAAKGRAALYRDTSARRTRRADATEAFEVQEQHEATEPVMVRLTGERQKVRCRRRVHDARLWDAMDGDQERAADAILAAYEVMAGPLRTAAMVFERTDGRPPTPEDDARAQERLAKLLSTYYAWRRRCRANNLDDRAICSVLCEGNGLRQVDREFRHKNGWSRGQVLNGLALYAALAGWGRHYHLHKAA